jgi:hypothetical protein
MDNIRIGEIALDGHAARPKARLFAEVAFDETDRVFTARLDALGIDVFSETLQGLEDALQSQLRILWRRYACEEDAKLTPKARRLKRGMVERFEEVAAGSSGCEEKVFVALM